jgi:CHAD domain-containing protein
VRRHLAERLNLRAEGIERGLVYHDTFDWLLHRAGFTLEIASGQGHTARLTRISSGQVEEQPVESTPPGFIRDWPRGPVKRLAERYSDVRAVLPLVSLNGSSDRFAVLNRDGKTVCRLCVDFWRVDQAGSSERSSWSRVRIMPMRGWHVEGEKVAQALAEAGFPAAASPTLDTSLAAVGRFPRDYSSKFRIQLDPGNTAAQAARAILSKLFEDIERNEAGTRGDIDPEFLHDFRVSVRRTRSALWAFREVFGAAQLKPHEESFRALGRVTGDKRNLDVHLIDFDSHLDLLEAHHRAALLDLRGILEARHRAAGEQLAAYLKSPAYKKFKRSWRAFLENEEATGPQADSPVKRFADRSLWRVYRKIIKHGRAIDDKSPDEALHDLRKRAKKFRYLLEFFQSLYPAKHIKGVIDDLKKLQDQLGLFQDQCVQMETLDALVTEETTPTAAEAVDVLLSGLAARRRRTRADFGKHFRRFDGKARRAQHKRLFKPSVDGK